MATEAKEHLIYDENCFVKAELRCPSPTGEWELVYRGLRHLEKKAISVVKEILLVSPNGCSICLKDAQTPSIYRRNLITEPWSPDGKWLVYPVSKWAYHFCPVSKLNDLNVIPLEVKEGHNYVLEGGHWHTDGTFTFHAGFSGWSAPYHATISEDGVSYRQTGKMTKQ